MRIGIIVLSVGNFGNKGFYNLQEIGLAKELDKFCEEVLVYKLVNKHENRQFERISGTKNANILYIPCKTLGTNGIINVNELDSTLDGIICFSDTQLMVKNVFNWCKINNVKFIPYIGVVQSHSTSKLKSIIINLLAMRNFKIYKRCKCLAKTPGVANALKNKDINDIIIAPVGLDISLLNNDFEKYSIFKIKESYGYKKEDKIILFIGRLIYEKQPIKMINIFKSIQEYDKSYKLLMVGKGELQQEVECEINRLNLQPYIKLINQIENSEIWKLYRISECFVNLNEHEIYGMALIESMYYGCKVIAWDAPGPRFILSNNKSGYIVNSDLDLINTIISTNNNDINLQDYVIKNFSWEGTSKKIIKLFK